jgi:predicted NBD/HSP70 family sugar kinase
LPWKNVPIQKDVEFMLNTPVFVENDANLAGLSEAKNIIDDYKNVLYITISTGIGTGVIKNGIIDPMYADSEGGHIQIEHNGKHQIWEKVASGKAIVTKYGNRASDIADPKAWEAIARNIAVGLIDLLAVIQPEAVVIGGGVGSHLHKFKKQLVKELKKYENPLVPIPPILKAKKPEEAVVYGCYDLIKDRDAKSIR